MAAGTGSRFCIVCCKLPVVRIGVASFASLSRAFELNPILSRQNFMAGAAGHRAMHSQKRKLGLRMVKAVHVDPRFGVVAGLATKRGSVWPPPLHPVPEFPMMRIEMTGCATLILELKRQDLVGAPGNAGLVAVGTGNRCVRAS